MWRQANKVEGKDDFLELLTLMSARQMQEDADFDNAKVLIQINILSNVQSIAINFLYSASS